MSYRLRAKGYMLLHDQEATNRKGGSTSSILCVPDDALTFMSNLPLSALFLTATAADKLLHAQDATDTEDEGAGGAKPQQKQHASKKKSHRHDSDEEGSGEEEEAPRSPRKRADSPELHERLDSR